MNAGSPPASARAVGDVGRHAVAEAPTVALVGGCVADLLVATNNAAADAARLLAAGEVQLASGALTVMLRTMLLRAATPAGSEGVTTARDIAIKLQSAESLAAEPRTGIE